MDIAKKRIARELTEIQKNKEKDGIYVESINDDLLKLKGYFKGPQDTPYESGNFVVTLNIPKTYPFNPPAVKFETKVWHPNVSSVTGLICLDILNREWAAAMTLRTILISLQALMCEPQPNDPQDAVVATQLLNEPGMFNVVAKQWTRIYASGRLSQSDDKTFDEKVSQLVQMGVKENEAVAVLSNNDLSIQKAVEKYFS